MHFFFFLCRNGMINICTTIKCHFLTTFPREAFTHLNEPARRYKDAHEKNWSQLLCRLDVHTSTTPNAKYNIIRKQRKILELQRNITPVMLE